MIHMRDYRFRLTGNFIVNASNIDEAKTRLKAMYDEIPQRFQGVAIVASLEGVQIKFGEEAKPKAAGE